MLDKLERKLGRFAIPNLVTFLVAGQVGSWILSKTPQGGAFLNALELYVPAVLRGEVWRLISFMFVAPSGGLFGDLFLIFYFLLMFMYGRALEAQWGEFRFNAYVFVGWLATVAAAFLVGRGTNLFVMESLLFAFAYLFPDYELRLFFILPVKIKWIALLVAAQMIYSAYLYVASGAWPGALLVVAGVLNFVLFFGRDMVRRLRGRARRTSRRRAAERAAQQPTHECAVCGKTDLDDPEMQFRYCSKCDGKRGYCMDHLRDHEHVRG
jgi:membrane associated rhomboid family serine protease